MSYDYEKAVEVENIRENADLVAHAINGMSREDAMNALGAMAAHAIVTCWPEEVRVDLLDRWFSRVRKCVVEYED